MRIKVRGGTASNGEPSLCLTCRFATVVKGASLRDEIVECSQLSYGRNRVTFPVTQCTEYSDRRQPSLRAMEEIAWVLRSDPKKNTIGFVKRAELTCRERFGVPRIQWRPRQRRFSAASNCSGLTPPR
jgi:hypothetical protein